MRRASLSWWVSFFISSRQQPKSLGSRRCHSPSLSRFFTNRHHRKVCDACGKINALARETCTFCLTTLYDETHIRPVGRDCLAESVVAQPKEAQSSAAQQCGIVNSGQETSSVHQKPRQPAFRLQEHLSSPSLLRPLPHELSRATQQQEQSDTSSHHTGPNNIIRKTVAAIGRDGDDDNGVRVWRPQRQEPGERVLLFPEPPLPPTICAASAQKWSNLTACLLRNQTPPLLTRNNYSRLHELHRNFHVLAALHPFPVAAVHLCVLPKGTMYDIKQLRPSHELLLSRMLVLLLRIFPLLVERLVESLRRAALYEDMQLLFQEEFHRVSVAVPELPELSSSSVAATTAYAPSNSDDSGRLLCALPEAHRTLYCLDDDQSSLAGGSGAASRKGREKSGQRDTFSPPELVPVAADGSLHNWLIHHSLLGFCYPSDYSHLHLHVLIPPLLHFELLSPPYFYPLSKVVRDLRGFGQVQTYKPLSFRERVQRSPFVEEAKHVHSQVLQRLHDFFCATARHSRTSS